MRVVYAVLMSFVVLSPAPAAGQTWEVQGSAGPTTTDPGHSVALGVGVSPTSRLTFLLTAERTHLTGGTGRDGDVFWRERGGTVYLGTAELRVTPWGRDRIGPFLLAGVSAGVSHPNVNAAFPTRVSNDVRALAVGGGLLVPLRHDVAIVAEYRFIYGTDGVEGIVAVAPIRAGVSWRF
jgi:hypothetical protein